SKSSSSASSAMRLAGWSSTTSTAGLLVMRVSLRVGPNGPGIIIIRWHYGIQFLPLSAQWVAGHSAGARHWSDRGAIHEQSRYWQTGVARVTGLDAFVARYCQVTAWRRLDFIGAAGHGLARLLCLRCLYRRDHRATDGAGRLPDAHRCAAGCR